MGRFACHILTGVFAAITIATGIMALTIATAKPVTRANK